MSLSYNNITILLKNNKDFCRDNVKQMLSFHNNITILWYCKLPLLIIAIMLTFFYYRGNVKTYVSQTTKQHHNIVVMRSAFSFYRDTVKILSLFIIFTYIYIYIYIYMYT